MGTPFPFALRCGKKGDVSHKAINGNVSQRPSDGAEVAGKSCLSLEKRPATTSVASFVRPRRLADPLFRCSSATTNDSSR